MVFSDSQQKNNNNEAQSKMTFWDSKKNHCWHKQNFNV